MARCPLLYVRGNHDDDFALEPPEGCICIEDRIYVHQGIRILGLGGSYRYRKGNNMFTEAQMGLRILGRSQALAQRRNRHSGNSRSRRHINDFETLTHRGFECFVRLLDQYRPKYFVHGHIHKNYGPGIPERSVYHGTTIINASGRYVFEY